MTDPADIRREAIEELRSPMRTYRMRVTADVVLRACDYDAADDLARQCVVAAERCRVTDVEVEATHDPF